MELLTALMLEGKMSGEGLEGFEEDDDMITSMVRELLVQGKVGERADAIWAALACERARLRGFDDITAFSLEAEGTNLGNEQTFEVGQSVNSSKSVRKLVESEPGLLSTYKMVPVPITSGPRLGSCQKPYPLKTRRRRLMHTRSGQLLLFDCPPRWSSPAPQGSAHDKPVPRHAVSSRTPSARQKDFQTYNS